jgi:hypothetical protein
VKKWPIFSGYNLEWYTRREFLLGSTECISWVPLLGIWEELAGWFWLRLSQEATFKMLGITAVIWRFNKLWRISIHCDILTQSGTLINTGCWWEVSLPDPKAAERPYNMASLPPRDPGRVIHSQASLRCQMHHCATFLSLDWNHFVHSTFQEGK